MAVGVFIALSIHIQAGRQLFDVLVSVRAPGVAGAETYEFVIH